MKRKTIISAIVMVLFTIIPTALADTIYWTEFDPARIMQSNIDGSEVEEILSLDDESLPMGIELDLVGGKMYWASYDSGWINRANLDGTEVESIICPMDSGTIGLDIDIKNGKIYWTNLEQGLFSRANLDGSQIEILASGLGYPPNISLDIAGGKMYWADNEANKIYSANLDGTDMTIIHSGLNGPWGIALALESNKAPVADAGLDITVSADGQCGETVILDGAGSSDEDGDELSYRWYYQDEPYGEGVQVEAPLGLGEHTFVLIVNDGTEDSLPDEVVVTVVDDTPPQLTVSVDKNALWPANGKMIEIVPTFEVTDNCGEEAVIELVGISCNQESESAIEVADGKIKLCATRDAKDKAGRVYTITYKATDNAGNESTATVEVKVRHDMRKQK